MERVDAMKTLQGWTDISVLHFRDLGVFGEQILLCDPLRRLEQRHRPRAGRQLGPLLAAGDPGLHPRLPGGHGRRPDRPTSTRRSGSAEQARARALQPALPPAAAPRRAARAAPDARCAQPGRAAARAQRVMTPDERPSACSTSPPRSIWACGTRARRLRPWAPAHDRRAGRARDARGSRRRRPRAGRPARGASARRSRRSTLHVFWDLFRHLAGRRPRAIYMDAGAYPIARWGVERAAARGVPVRDVRAPRRRRRCGDGSARSRRAAPLVVTDGFCPGCGRAAPLGAYLGRPRSRLGGQPGRRRHAGAGRARGATARPSRSVRHGGGGSLAWHKLASSDVDRRRLAREGLRRAAGRARAAPTRPSRASRRGARRACTAARRRSRRCTPPSTRWRVNRMHGDMLRPASPAGGGLVRDCLRGRSVPDIGGGFPVQTLPRSQTTRPCACTARCGGSAC